MKHRVKGKKLNRDTAHRKSLVKNLSTSLIENKQVVTTLAKAKYIRPYVERLVTKARKDKGYETVRYMENKLTTPGSVKTLISEIAPLYKDRNGGYLRIIKLKERDGDKAKMARIEFIMDKDDSKKKIKDKGDDKQKRSESLEKNNTKEDQSPKDNAEENEIEEVDEEDNVEDSSDEEENK
jgi:large subunit ribosomal protein L17